MDALIQDLRLGLRALRRSPGFTLVACAMLALGIGANAAMFSGVNALLLRPVHFAGLERLVMLWERSPRLGIERGGVSPADFEDWRSQCRSYEGLAALQGWDANLTGGDEPERVSGCRVSPELFGLLRVRPALGRGLRPDEARSGRDQVAVLSHGLWRRRFGADPRVIGRTLVLDGYPHLVVGVMPADFEFPMAAQFWTPLAFVPEQLGPRDLRILTVVGRLRAGATLAAARAELSTLARRLEREYPETHTGWTAHVTTLTQGVVDEFSPRFMWVATGAVGFVLLLVCANLAGLLLARAVSRRKEIAIRTALGASRARLVRQLLTESLLLAVGGASLGMLVAAWGVDFMKASIPAEVTRLLPGWRHFGLDGAVLAFTALAAVASALLFGLAPALHASQPDLQEALKEGGRTSRAPGTARSRGALVVIQVALTLVLLVGSGLLVSGYQRLARQSQGFDPRHVLTLRLTLPDTRYATGADLRLYARRALERAAALPGVESAALGNRLPLSGGGGTERVTVEGRPAARRGEQPRVDRPVVDPGYFETFRIPILQGRAFDGRDREDAPPVAVVSETMARRSWPGQSPLGRRLRLGPAGEEGPWVTVVGVAADVKRSWIDREFRPTVYLPLAQAPRRSLRLAVRTSGDPLALLPALREQLLAVDRDLPPYAAATMEQELRDQASGVRLTAVLLGFFGFLAVLLAAVGLYGVVAHATSQRTHEFGVRMALGARPGDVRRMVLAHAGRLALAGLAIGLPAALVLAHLLARLLFGVVVVDWTAFAAAPLLMAVMLAASDLPARQATRVDPMLSLRAE